MVALGAAVGAPARYLTDRAVQRSHDSQFPWGTLTVNVSASLMIGVLTGLGGHVSAQVGALLGIGFCGALSTFSTFSYETMRLVEDRLFGYALANIALSLGAGLGAATIGWSLAAAIA